MTDEEIAYQIAEERIAKAKAEGLEHLALCPGSGGDWEADSRLRRLTTLPPEIADLTGLIHLDLDNTQVADIAPLARMVGMQMLYLSNTQVAGIAPLARMEVMQTLFLSNTMVADIAPLARMEGMRRLYLSNTQVADIAPLARMEGMQTLNLSDTQVADIAPLARMEGMQTLDLSNTQVADIAPLARMEGMQTLYLSDTQVADIAPLARMEGMQTLNLSDTQVADIAPLARMEGMQSLDLSNTRVADLRRIAGLTSLVKGAKERFAGGIAFQNISATQLDPEGLGRLAEIVDSGERTEKTLAYLSSLTEWPPRRRQPPPPPPPPTDRAHVFLSYSRGDSARAKTLREALEADGVTIWQDVDMPFDRPFRPEIEERIAGAEAVLVLWSEASIASEYVASEAERGRVGDKLVSAALDAVTPPPPFDGYNTCDLSNWDGDREEPHYQRLLWTLRPELTPGSGLGVRENADGTFAPEQQPVQAPLRNASEDGRARAIRLQIERTEDLIEDAADTNVHPATDRRLKRYLKALQAEEPLWTPVSEKFDGVAPLLTAEQGMDHGMENAVGHFFAGHDALREFLDKVDAPEPPDAPPEIDPEDAPGAAAAVAGAAAIIRDSDLGPAVPEALETEAEAIEAEALDQMSEEGEQRLRRRLGRAVYVSAGLLGALGSAASIASFGSTVEGQALLMQIGEAWRALMALLKFAA